MNKIAHLKPVRSLLLLDTTPQEEVTGAGIIIPIPGKGMKITTTTKYGTIVAVGPDVEALGKHIDGKGKHYFHAPGLVVGARVVVAKYASDHINENGNRYHFAEASEVMAIIYEEDDAEPEDDGDPAPWCAYCGSMTRKGCDCPPTAEREGGGK